MSRTRELHEGQRWLDTAAEDLHAARVLMAGELHARACFAAQQCGGKALKGVCHANGEEPWGHSVQKLVMACGALAGTPDLLKWRKAASALDRLYIATRYPNGLPDLTPEQSYFREDAEEAIRQAEWMLGECRQMHRSLTLEHARSGSDAEKSGDPDDTRE